MWLRSALVVAPAAVVSLAPPGDLVTPPALGRFVTQRAVQQQLYYFDMMGDETSGDFLADFLRREGDDSMDADFHGISCLPAASSTAYLCALLEADDLEIVVKKEMGCGGGRGHGGINTFTGEVINRQNNPYLKPRYFEYTIDVRPAEIARRIFGIREQIALETAADLRDVVAREAADVRARALYDEERAVWDDTRMGTDGGRSSPFRGATYDLALQLVTATAVEALVATGDFAGLGEIWRAHRPAFYRHNPWTRGDPLRRSVTHEFFKAVVAMAPEMRGATLKMDPTADAILDARADVARAWAASLDAVPEEHLAWNRWSLQNALSRASGG